MHVFRLGSKSVNYANKIIMQEAKSAGDSPLVAYQLMKNISLSNLSDTETIQSDDNVDDNLRLRKFSLENTVLYANQFNNPYDPMEQRRKHSIDYRFKIAQ